MTGTRWHGENGVWVYGQSCQALAGWVVDVDLVERYCDEVGDPGDCSDWVWWDEELATLMIERVENATSFGPNEAYRLRAACNVLKYLTKGEV